MEAIIERIVEKCIQSELIEESQRDWMTYLLQRKFMNFGGFFIHTFSRFMVGVGLCSTRRAPRGHTALPFFHKGTPCFWPSAKRRRKSIIGGNYYAEAQMEFKHHLHLRAPAGKPAAHLPLRPHHGGGAYGLRQNHGGELVSQRTRQGRSAAHHSHQRVFR